MELVKKRKIVSDTEARYFMWQLMEALMHLHKNLVIHRDLKLANLFLDENMCIKVGDFGLATKLIHKDERKKTICGTPNYIAPEVLGGHRVGHSFEVDIWSSGVILYTMLIGRPPFETTDVKSTYRKIKANSYGFPDHATISVDAKDLIQEMLHSSPEKRPTIEGVLTSRFMTGGRIPKCLPPSCREKAPTMFTFREDCENVMMIGSKAESATLVPSHTAVDSATSIPGIRGITETESRPALHPLSGNTKIASATSSSGGTKALTARGRGDRSPLRFGGAKHLPIVATARLGFLTDRSDRTKEIASSGRVGTAPSGRHIVSTSSTTTTTALARPAWEETEFPAEKEETEAMLPPTKPHPVVEAKQDVVQVVHDIDPKKTFAPAQPSSHDPLVEHVTKVWVCKWADFSSRYGLAYRLNTGETGAHYNDSTKMIMDTKGTIEYFDRQRLEAGAVDVQETHSVSEYPESLKKKVTLIKYFQSHLQQESSGEDTDGAVGAVGRRDDAEIGVVYVKRWLLTRHAIIFRLSNKCVQVIFHDNTEILLSAEGKIVTYVDGSGHRQVFSLNDVAMHPDHEVAKRLKYTKGILYQLIHNGGSADAHKKSSRPLHGSGH
eukprot:TRINITY_DN2739_c0_g1_i1.p1 TRINITY_DN2739_c0_g1~~TRINITY_DN2739_c0_g1_i1.p1  ORF type:complete len:609 (-),score=162.51 TRINITY_DN2739_c0_g1_i1:279-2105(-)